MEADFVRYFQKAIEPYPCVKLPRHTSQINGVWIKDKEGVPDTVFCTPRGVFFLEFKYKDGKLRPSQKNFFELWNFICPHCCLIVAERSHTCYTIEDENYQVLYSNGDKRDFIDNFVSQIYRIRFGQTQKPLFEDYPYNNEPHGL